jgi:serine/threonine-protein kinase
VAELVARLQTALGDAYRVEKEIGGGGMSRVFQATEASLHRQVVIKVLPPELASEVSQARFRQERVHAGRREAERSVVGARTRTGQRTAGESVQGEGAFALVATVWRHADPELQPYVEEAKAALARLGSEPRR